MASLVFCRSTASILSSVVLSILLLLFFSTSPTTCQLQESGGDSGDSDDDDALHAQPFEGEFDLSFADAGAIAEAWTQAHSTPLAIHLPAPSLVGVPHNGATVISDALNVSINVADTNSIQVQFATPSWATTHVQHANRTRVLPGTVPALLCLH